MNSLKLSANQVRAFIAISLVGSLTFLNWPFLMPLFLGGLFALGTRDLVQALARLIKVSYIRAVWIGMGLGLFLFWFPLFIATYRVFVFFGKKNIEGDSFDWMSKLHLLKDWTLQHIQSLSEMIGIDLTSPIQSLFEKSVTVAGESILKLTTDFFQQLPNLFIASVVFTVSLFTFLAGAEPIKKIFLNSELLPQSQLENLVNAAKKSCRLTLFSTILIGLVQALFIGFGSLLFNQGDFWLVMILTFFLSFIPVIGAAPVGLVLAALAFMDGNTGSALGLAVISSLAGSIDNILKPSMMSTVVKVPVILAFTSVIGAIVMLGLPGLIVGPIVLNLTVLVLPLLSEQKKSGV